MDIHFNLLDKTEIEDKIIIGLDITKNRIRNCIINSLINIEKGQKLISNDNEMAAFRSITAIEEASTAFFLTLKEKSYKNSEKINEKDHLYKNSLLPYIIAIRDEIAHIEPYISPMKLFIREDNNQKFLGIKLTVQGIQGAPEPPLGFSLSKFHSSNNVEINYHDVFINLSKKYNADSLSQYLKNFANERNIFLYASNTTVPEIKNDIQKKFNTKRNQVFIILALIALIYPYNKKSIFIEEALEGFITAVEHAKKKVK